MNPTMQNQKFQSEVGFILKADSGSSVYKFEPSCPVSN